MFKILELILFHSYLWDYTKQVVRIVETNHKDNLWVRISATLESATLDVLTSVQYQNTDETTAKQEMGLTVLH